MSVQAVKQVNAIAEYRARLPMPEGLGDGWDARRWRVLCEATFPNARTAESIVMALDYCKARGLDVFKKPVHIVPMWNSSLKREVETVWPGINEVQITAARTGQWAGMDEPKWGPDKTEKFTGRRKVDGQWENAEESVTFPEWCAVTVYRMINGQRCPFTEPVFWLEAYSRAGGAKSRLPTDMWVKRPHGQLQKVAKAAALRAAFPEEGEYTAEEMEGKEIDAGGIVIDQTGAPVDATPPKTTSPIKPQAIAAPTHDPQTGEVGPHKIPLPTGDSPYIAWGQLFIAAVNAAQSIKEIRDWIEANKKTSKDIAKDAPKIAERIAANVGAAIKRFDGVAGNGTVVPTPTDPEAFRAYVLAKFKEAKDAGALNAAWETYVEPAKADIFPPDLSELTDAFNATMSEIEE